MLQGLPESVGFDQTPTLRLRGVERNRSRVEGNRRKRSGMIVSEERREEKRRGGRVLQKVRPDPEEEVKGRQGEERGQPEEGERKERMRNWRGQRGTSGEEAVVNGGIRSDYLVCGR